MARLNEPPAPAESIDALKRRFIRQNRDIARANSTQSLRIRNLESEVSRLLSENLSLRERVVRLQHEVDRRVDHSIFDEMGAIKRKIETKLTELGSSVQELSKIQTEVENHHSVKRRTSIKKSPVKSPDPKNWKNALTLSEVTCSGESRLPPIVEGKYFPRKTLDVEGSNGISLDVANVTDSPEIGPPPVAHFEDGDPANFYPERRYIATKTSPKSEGKGRPDKLMNLEVRKKRRETSNHGQSLLDETIDKESLETSNASIISSSSLSQPFKSGAKRKLNSREGEDKGELTEASNEDEFLFDRRPVRSNKASPTKQDSIKPETSASIVMSQDLSKGASSARATNSSTTGKGRKVLGPKNANIDPTSPTKVSRLATSGKNVEFNDQKKPADGNIFKDKTSKNRHPVLRKPDPTDSLSLGIDAVKPGPETPAPAAPILLSPVSSEPLVTRQESSDTPPPGEISTDAAGTAAGRATRRPRGSVSYAEPNLRAKMRRPTNDLVDAVERAQNVITIRDVENAEPEPKQEKGGLRTVVIKKEDTANNISSWKIPSSVEDQTQTHNLNREESSPLMNRTSAPSADLPASIIADRRRRSAGISNSDNETYGQKHPLSNSASTNNLITAEDQNPTKPDSSGKAANQEANTGDIHPPTTISPPSPPTKPDPKKDRPIAKPTRRHTNLPSDEPLAKASGAGGTAIVAMARARERKREQRLSAMIDGRTGGELGGAKSLAGLRGGDEGMTGRAERAERAATRRRSMVL